MCGSLRHHDSVGPPGGGGKAPAGPTPGGGGKPPGGGFGRSDWGETTGAGADVGVRAAGAEPDCDAGAGGTVSGSGPKSPGEAPATRGTACVPTGMGTRSLSVTLGARTMRGVREMHIGFVGDTWITEPMR